jgi:hypothetical protein
MKTVESIIVYFVYVATTARLSRMIYYDAMYYSQNLQNLQTCQQP